MIIYLFRHGETDWNKEYRLQGRSDIPLNDLGRAPALKTAAALTKIPFCKAFCSPLRRAAETAEILINGREIPLTRDERLMEMCFGDYEGDFITEAKREDSFHPLHDFFRHPERYVPPEGAESFQEVTDRGMEFLRQEIGPLEGSCQNVLIVAHGAFNRCILSAVAGIPLKDFWEISLPNCAASVLSLKGGVFRVEEESRVYYGNPVNGRP